MKETLIKAAVRTRFTLTGRNRASHQIHDQLERYLTLAARLDAESGARPIRVPPMLGIDPDMRRWSFFMLLEHHTIVNRTMSTLVQSLSKGRFPPELQDFDGRKDVMPSVNPGPEQVEAFRISVEEHLAVVPHLGRLRGGSTSPHPLFGDFDAHKWHCMVGFHLKVHLKQAERIAREAGA